MSDRAKLIERIKALMAKTTAAGCTEGEALAAMQKARELMDKYQIGSNDLLTGGEECELKLSERQDSPYDIRRRLSYWIAKYCDCQAWWRSSDGEAGAIRYFGLATDALFATWLSDMLNDFCNREATRMFGYADRSAKHRKAKSTGAFDSGDLFGGVNAEHLRASFVQGFCDRVNQRLKELTDERSAGQRLADGRSLVVVKMALVHQAFAKLGIHIRRAGPGRYSADPRAYVHGAAAGDRANFSRPVGGSNRPKSIAAG